MIEQVAAQGFDIWSELIRFVFNSARQAEREKQLGAATGRARPPAEQGKPVIPDGSLVRASAVHRPPSAVRSRRRVLFVCTGNTCRSQMAEGIARHERGADWEAFSAGTRPGERVNPFAVRALSEIGIDIAGARPKTVESLRGQHFDLAITLCDSAAQECPRVEGAARQVHIPMPDPADATGSEAEVLAVYRAVRDAICAQVIPLLDEF